MDAPWWQSLGMADDDGIIPEKLDRTRGPYRDDMPIARGMTSIATAILKRGGYDRNGQSLENTECVMCPKKFRAERGNALTCSDRCRKRLSRLRKAVKDQLAQSTEDMVRARLEVDPVFADALLTVAKADGYDRATPLDARKVKRSSPMSGDLLENGRNVWDAAV